MGTYSTRCYSCASTIWFTVSPKPKCKWETWWLWWTHCETSLRGVLSEDVLSCLKQPSEDGSTVVIKRWWSHHNRGLLWHFNNVHLVERGPKCSSKIPHPPPHYSTTSNNLNCWYQAGRTHEFMLFTPNFCYNRKWVFFCSYNLCYFLFVLEVGKGFLGISFSIHQRHRLFSNFREPVQILSSVSCSSLTGIGVSPCVVSCCCSQSASRVNVL